MEEPSRKDSALPNAEHRAAFAYTVRAARAEDLPALQSVRERENKDHVATLAEQERGRLTYLIAERQGIPLGWCCLMWEGKATAPDIPDVCDLWILPALRGLGIGTSLLAACETLCRERGFRQIGLAVNPKDNPAARRLYERLGFRAVSEKTYLDGIYHWTDKQGQLQEYEDWCVDMVKVF